MAPIGRIAIAALCLAFLGAGGCKSSQPELTYSQAYDQKLYEEALVKAGPVAEDPKRKDHEKAALIAGMSAYSLQKYDEATKYLSPLRASLDKEVAGRSRATLGLIARAQGRHAEAAALLAGSADSLDGDESAKAKLFAGDSYRRVGLEAKARAEYRDAAADTADPALKQTLQDRNKPILYYIQTGAYATRDAADKQAAALRSSTVRLRQPLPKVLPVAGPGGKTLFAVQIGPYGSKGEAQGGLDNLQLKGASLASRQ